MGWVKLVAVFYFVVRVLNWFGMEEAMSRRAKWILTGVCVGLFLIAAYADYVARQ